MTACLAAPARRMAVLVLMEGVSLAQLTAVDDPAFRAWLDDSALGVMTNRTRSHLNLVHNAVSLGAGNHAVGGRTTSLQASRFWTIAKGPADPDTGEFWARAAYNANELVDGTPAGARFTARTGQVPPAGAVVHLMLPEIRAANAAFPEAGVVPGLLGETLHTAGVPVSVFGNADYQGRTSRCGVAVAMNTDGWVPWGDVGPRTLRDDPTFPGGRRSDEDYLLQQVAAFSADVGLIVIEAGDGARLESAGLDDATLATEKTRMLRRYASFLKRLDRHLTSSTDAYLLVLAVPEQDRTALNRHEWLTPVLLRGTALPAGLLQTDTTRRTGLIANIDLAPTLLHFFGLPTPEGMLGKPIIVQPSRTARATLLTMVRQMVLAHHTKPPIIIGVIILAGAAVLWGLLTALRRQPASPLLRTALLAILLLPAAFLVAGGLGLYSLAGTSLFLAAATLLPAAWLQWRSDIRLALARAGAVVTVAYLLDLLVGSPLLQRSMMSYEALSGMRYYGLGNESCGVLLGAALLGLYAWYDLRGPLRLRDLLLIGLGYLVIFILIGSPRFGADMGGMLSAIPGFAVALAKASKGFRRGVVVTVLLATAVLLLAVMVAVNAAAGYGHIGMAATQIAHHGPGALLAMAWGKLSVSLRLIVSSPWTVLVVLVLLSISAVLVRPVGRLRAVLAAHRIFAAGLLGLVVSLLAAMITNDTGLAMAGAGLAYLVPPVLLLALRGAVQPEAVPDTTTVVRP